MASASNAAARDLTRGAAGAGSTAADGRGRGRSCGLRRCKPSKPSLPVAVAAKGGGVCSQHMRSSRRRKRQGTGTYRLPAQTAPVWSPRSARRLSDPKSTASLSCAAAMDPAQREAAPPSHVPDQWREIRTCVRPLRRSQRQWRRDARCLDLAGDATLPRAASARERGSSSERTEEAESG